MAESPFAPMDPITQGMSPEEIMMLIQQRQLAQPGAYMPEMPPQSPFEAAAPMPAPTADMPFEGNNLPPGSSDPVSARGFEDLLTAPARGVVNQFDKAGEAGKDFLVDPSIPNAANAGVQTGAALMRPGMMLGSAAIGVGDALLKDVGGVGSAEAKSKKRAPAPDVPDLPGLPDAMQPAYKDTKRKLESEEWMPRDTRKSLADQMRQFMDMAAQSAGRQGEVDQQKKLDEQAGYDRKVRRADEVYQTEMGRDRRWSDTATGKFLNSMGGIDPFVSAVGAGYGMGKVKAMMGPATSIGGKIAQSPFIAGTAAAFGVNNIPDAYNASKLEPDNPRKRALEGRGMELPEGHPDKQSSLDAAAPMKDTNPVRDAALKNLTDPMTMAGRLGYSAMEGLGAHLPGAYAYAKGKFKGAGAGAGDGATPLAPSGPAAPGPSLGPSAGGPPALPKQPFDPARLAPPTPAQKASGFSKTMSPADLQEAAKAHREALIKYRSDPSVPEFFERNKDLGPKKLKEAFEAEFGPLRQKSVLNLKTMVGKDAAAKGVEDARMQLAATAKGAQGEARMVWDSIAQGGNASYRDVKQIMPQIREAFPALKDMSDRQLGNLIRNAARGQ